MKKIASILSLTGLIGLFSVIVYAKTNISIFINFLPLLVILKSFFFGGILCFIAAQSEKSLSKTISFSLFIIGTILTILSVSNFLPINSLLGFEISLIIASYLIMISLIFEKSTKYLIQLAIIFPILLLVGINSILVGIIGLVYIILISMLSVYKTIK